MKIRTDRLPCRVAIVGSRDYPARGDIVSFVRRLPPGTEVISGGARGVDTWAIEAAAHRGLLTHVCAPDSAIPSPARFMIRNQRIVDRAWAVIAFSTTTDGVTPTRGTADTVRKAERAGLPAIVILTYGTGLILAPNNVAREWGLVT